MTSLLSAEGLELAYGEISACRDITFHVDEGETLAITVNGFNDQTWFDRSGNHHTEGLTVEERYTLQGENVLIYEATMTDPKTFTRPWKIRMPLYRRLEPNVQLLEFKCVEFSEELLYGDLKKK